MYNMTCV